MIQCLHGHMSGRSKSGDCRECSRLAALKYYARNREKLLARAKLNPKKPPPEVARRNRLKRVYGITVDQYNAMLERQGGMCAICLAENPNAVDHCHETGRVRGILCAHCNSALGFMKDNKTAMNSAVSYLFGKTREITDNWSSGLVSFGG